MADKDGIPWGSVAKGAVEGFLKGIYDWFRGRKKSADPSAPASEEPNPRGILIIGPGGVGKTTLARILSGEFDWLSDDPWRYAESVSTERYALEDDPIRKSSSRQASRTGERVHGRRFCRTCEPACAEASFSFPRTATTRRRPKRPATIRITRGTNPTWWLACWKRIGRRNCRRSGGGRGRRVAGEVVAASPDRQAGLVGVEAGGGGSPLLVGGVHRPDRADAERGRAARFQYESHSVCLVISNWTTQGDERLKPNEAGYDYRRQVATVRRLFEIILSLTRWEDES